MKISTALASFVSFLILTLSFVPARGQITLTPQNMKIGASTFTADTLIVTGMAAPTRGANKTWDFTHASINNEATEHLYTANDPNFSSAAVYDTFGFEPLTTIKGTLYGVFFHDVFDLHNGPIAATLEHPAISLATQGYNMGAVSGNPSDSLWVLQQDAIYTTADSSGPNPVTIINYGPSGASFGQSWNTFSARRAINMKAKVALLSVLYGSQFDFRKVTYINTYDSVAGWGTLSVPTSGSPVTNIPVLLIRHSESRVDSFYINDTVPALIVLQQFNLAEGHDTTYYSDAFYTTGSIMPALKIDYTDSTYSKANFAYSYTQAASGVEEPVSNNSGIRIYPNPSQSRDFYLATENPLAPSDRIELSDITGKRVNVEQFPGIVNGTLVPISLPASVNAGTYFVLVSHANGTSDEAKIVIQ